MEGRAPPPRRPRPDDRHIHGGEISIQRSKLPISTKQPSKKQPPDSDKYVVQLPKDQIYHVPPPERHEFVQRAREEQSNVKPYQTRTFKIAVILIICIIVISIALNTLVPLLISVKSPLFSISRVSIEHLSTSSVHSSSYRITVKAKNPNKKMSMYYHSVGIAYLTFKGEPIGLGKIPDLVQGEGRSSDLRLLFEGSDEELPEKIKKSLEDSKPKDLVLKMSFSVRLKLGFIKTKASDTDVTCNLRVNALRRATKILRQHCQT